MIAADREEVPKVSGTCDDGGVPLVCRGLVQYDGDNAGSTQRNRDEGRSVQRVAEYQSAVGEAGCHSGGSSEIHSRR